VQSLVINSWILVDKMFGTSTFGGTSLFGGSTATTTNYNPMKDFEVPSPPDDSVSVLAFSPGTLPSTFLAAGSWDNNVSSPHFFTTTAFLSFKFMKFVIGKICTGMYM